MNIRRLILAALAVFVTFSALDLLIHGVILAGDYAAIGNVWRADMNEVMWMMYVASLVFSFVFAWLFARGYSASGLREGLLFGLVMGIGMNIMATLGSYTMYPLPGILCFKWFVFGMVEYCVAGIVVSLVYRD